MKTFFLVLFLIGISPVVIGAVVCLFLALYNASFLQWIVMFFMSCVALGFLGLITFKDYEE